MMTNAEYWQWSAAIDRAAAVGEPAVTVMRDRIRAEVKDEGKKQDLLHSLAQASEFTHHKE